MLYYLHSYIYKCFVPMSASYVLAVYYTIYYVFDIYKLRNLVYMIIANIRIGRHGDNIML